MCGLRGDNPEVSCANTAPGGAGANYGAPTWPANLTTGLGLGMQACIGGARQAWNYSVADGMLSLPKNRSCLGVPSVSSDHQSTNHPVVRQRAANGDCNASHPHPHQHHHPHAIRIIIIPFSAQCVTTPRPRASGDAEDSAAPLDDVATWRHGDVAMWRRGEMANWRSSRGRGSSGSRL